MQLNQLDELITIMACLPISAGWSLKCLQVSYCYLFDSAVTSSTLYAAGSIICMLCCGLLLEACNLFFLVFFLPFILRPMERVKHKNPSRIELRNDNKGGKGHIPEVTHMECSSLKDPYQREIRYTYGVFCSIYRIVL